MITRASARKGFSLLELILVLVVLGLLAAIAIPTYETLIGKTKDKTAIATAESVARNGIALAAFDGVGVVALPDQPVGTYLADAAGEVEGDNIEVGIPVAVPAAAPAPARVCVPLENIGSENVTVAVTFDAGLNAGFTAVAGTC